MRTGADPDQLDRLARTFATAADRVGHLSADLRQATQQAVWWGRDRELVMGHLDMVVSAMSTTVAADLADCADHLVQQARAQREASADVAGPSAPVRPHGHLPTFTTPSGAPGLADVVGDLTTATSVVVLVPGIGTDAGNFGRLVDDAHALAAAANERGDHVAVIAWLGYDAPGGFDEPRRLAEALDDDRAVAGAAALRRFLAALTVRADAEITLIGHSYGSLVAAGAARDNPAVDQVVVLGSPGLGVDHVADLGLLPTTHLLAMSTLGDPVSHSQWFGLDPTLPAFGARVLDGDAWPGTDPPSADRAHSAYFDEGSQPLDNLALVVTGRTFRLEPRSRLPWADSPLRVADVPFARAVWGLIDLVADEVRR